MKKILAPFALALALAALAPAAFAVGSATNPLNLSATVINNCTISTTPVAFGSYDPLSGAALTAGGTVVIACTKGAATTIDLGTGTHYITFRRMSDGTQFMQYELYQPPNTTPGTACNYASPTRWGTGFNPGASTGIAPRAYNVCGSIPAGQDLSAAAFTDTVVATVNF